jgi:hypothetical protein
MPNKRSAEARKRREATKKRKKFGKVSVEKPIQKTLDVTSVVITTLPKMAIPVTMYVFLMFILILKARNT